MFETAVLDSAKKRLTPDAKLLAGVKKALEEFKVPTEEELVDVDDNEPRHHPDNSVERYFHCATVYGKPCFEWELIRPAFLWKLKHVMHEMIRIDHNFCEESNRKLEEEEREKEGKENDENEAKAKEQKSELKETKDGIKREIRPKKTLPKVKADFDDEHGELKQLYDIILKKAEEFDGIPFTFQRICELLEEPSRLYTRAEKFYRALDKCINVVSTITPEGKRITGVEDFELDRADNGKIEQTFYGKVDELDDECWDPTTRFVGPHIVPPPVHASSLIELAAEDKPLDMSCKENGCNYLSSKQENRDGTNPTPSTFTSPISPGVSKCNQEAGAQSAGDAPLAPSAAEPDAVAAKPDEKSEDGSGDAPPAEKRVKTEEPEEEQPEKMDAEETPNNDTAPAQPLDNAESKDSAPPHAPGSDSGVEKKEVSNLPVADVKMEE